MTTKTSPDFSYAKRGLFVRLVYLFFSLVYAVAIGFGWFIRGRVIVLCYHAVTDTQFSRFEKQMQLIVSRVVKLNEVRNKDYKNDRVCVTFDDAFSCLLETVIPVTRKLNIPISVFAVTRNMGHVPKWEINEKRADKNYQIMTFQQLVDIDKQSHCLVGSHTISHQPLGKLSQEDVRKELIESKVELEHLLGHEITALALPHGSYNLDVIKTATEIGYQYILTLDEISNPTLWPENTIGRFVVSPDMWLIEFYLTAIGAYTWLYPWRRSLRLIRSVFR